MYIGSTCAEQDLPIQKSFHFSALYSDEAPACVFFEAVALPFLLRGLQGCRTVVLNCASEVCVMAVRCLSLHYLGLWLLLLAGAAHAVTVGNWHIVVVNAGVASMHMQLTHAGTVIMFDRTDYGPSQLRLPNGNCRHDPSDLALKVDCWAHSIEYTIADNTVRPLEILTDSWCSSGGTTSDGTLVSTGGYNDGAEAVRHFVPCTSNTCDWSEAYPRMGVARWYATNQILPDNSMIVIGGRQAFSYEFVPSKGAPVSFEFLRETYVPNVENNLYPFVHLSSDGNLFVFGNKQSILLNYKTNQVLKRFPDLPGGGGRNYPSSGSSVMLPLTSSDNFQSVEILICGGAPDGSFQNSEKQMTALQSCGRMVITDPEPAWEMETMPTPRVMGDMLILPTGEVLIINGGLTGVAGWGNVANPNYNPVLYMPNAKSGSRFQELAGTKIARLYHSTANLLPDGRILVAGSNPNVGYAFSGVKFATELRIEAYHPYYLDYSNNAARPQITYLSNNQLAYGSVFTVEFAVNSAPSNVNFRAYYPPFTTHTYSMSQRQLVLAASSLRELGGHFYAHVTAPPNAIAAPSGYYLLFVVNAGIPSGGLWVHFS